MVLTNLRNYGPFFADDLWVVLGFHAHGQLEAPQCLREGRGKQWLLVGRGRSLAQTSAALARSTRSSCSACSSFTLSRRPVFARSTLGTRPVILMTSDCCSGCGTEIFTWSTEDKGGGESRQGRRVIWLPDDQRAGLHWCTGGSSVGDLASALAGSLAYLAGLL